MRQVLGDEIDLARTLELEQLCLPHDIRQRERTMLAAHQRNRAERAPVIAPFTDLEVADVREVARINANPWMIDEWITDQPSLGQLRNQSIGFGCSEEEIHLGKRGRELVLVPLDEAADCDNSLTSAARLVSSGLD